MKRFKIVVMATFLALTACNFSYFQDPEFGEFIWDPTLAIPLGEVNYTVTELFTELDEGSADIGTGENNIVTIVYEEEINAQDASDFLEILDQNFDGSLLSGLTISNSPTEQRINIEELFEFDLRLQGNEAYDSIYFNSGTFNVSLRSDIDHVVNYTAEVLSLQKASSLVFEGDILPNSSDDLSDQLEGYKGYLNLDKGGNPATNKFLFLLSYEVVIPIGGNLSATEGVEFDISIQNSEYSDLFGNVGNQPLSIDLSAIDLSFFSIFTEGNLTFVDPKVEFLYKNSFGLPIGMNYSAISAKAKDGSTIPLSGSINDDLSIINGPTIEQAGQTIDTEHIIDVSNSNISDIFSSQPSQFSISLSAQANPPNGPVQYNFLNEINQLDAMARIEIPLEMNIDELVANESFDFKNAEDLDQAKRALMRVIATNDMPMGGNLELQFLNASGEVFYIIDERPVFEAAAIGSDGRTIGPSELITEILLEDEDLRQMESAARINIRARLNTTNAEDGTIVKFFEEYTLNMHIALLTDLEIKTSGE